MKYGIKKYVDIDYSCEMKHNIQTERIILEIHFSSKEPNITAKNINIYQ